jgi:hypothetical protein
MKGETQMDQGIEIGRLLRAGTTGFVVGCRVSQLESPAFGALVKAPVAPGYQIYGLIFDIHIDDDGLVRQLVTAGTVDENIIADNRLNRNVPLEMSVVTVGCRQDGKISHMLPPHPPLSLDVIELCSPKELCEFTSAGRFGYFRHVLRSEELPAGELLAAHLQQAQAAQRTHGNPTWLEGATRELITLLRDDYAILVSVLGALSELYPRENP